jgi:putative FmdB family regulatory protein
VPIYTYQHNEASECDDPFDVFQHMSDDKLEACPLCGESVYKVLTTCSVKVKGSAPSAGEMARREYGLARNEQVYQVPMSGEQIRTTGMSSREKRVAVWEGHVRAGDPSVDGVGPEKIDLIE